MQKALLIPGAMIGESQSGHAGIQKKTDALPLFSMHGWRMKSSAARLFAKACTVKDIKLHINA